MYDTQTIRYIAFFKLDESFFTLDQLKTAYRREVKIWHPDMNKSPDAAKIFNEINNAYEALQKLADKQGPAPRKEEPKPSAKAQTPPATGHKLYRMPAFEKLHNAYVIHVPFVDASMGCTVFIMIKENEYRLTLKPNQAYENPRYKVGNAALQVFVGNFTKSEQRENNKKKGGFWSGFA